MPAGTDRNADLDFTKLERAIFKRDLQQISYLLPKSHHQLEAMIDTGQSLGPLELAIGSPSILRQLVQVGFIRFQTVLTALSQREMESSRILLAEHDIQIDQQNAWHLIIQKLPTIVVDKYNGFASIIAIGSGRYSETVDETAEAVLRALKCQRHKLREYATEMLPRTELLRLGALQENVLDGAAPALYQTLLKSGVELPTTLNPALGPSCSIYHALLIDNNDVVVPRLLDQLFDNGFQSIDYSGWVDYDSSFHESVLYELFFTNGIFFGYGSVLGVYRWFLDKGASTRFSQSLNFPNLLHGLAIDFRTLISLDPDHGRTVYYPTQPQCHDMIIKASISRTKDLISRIITDNQALSIDRCVCPCSLGGAQHFTKCGNVIILHTCMVM